MPEYVTKEAVKQAMRSQPRGILFTEWELDQVPTVDVVEVDKIFLHHILIDENGIPEVKLQLGERVFILRNEDEPVDAVKGVHGQWKPDLHAYDRQPYRDEWYGYMFKCSVCGSTTMGEYDLECHANYCPNCGAKMDGGINK